MRHWCLLRFSVSFAALRSDRYSRSVEGSRSRLERTLVSCRFDEAVLRSVTWPTVFNHSTSVWSRHVWCTTTPLIAYWILSIDPVTSFAKQNWQPRTWNDLADDVHDVCRVVIQLLLATEDSPVHEVLLMTFSWTGLHLYLIFYTVFHKKDPLCFIHNSLKWWAICA